MDDSETPEVKKALFKAIRDLVDENHKGRGILDLNDENFEAFIKSHRGVVVDFWAPWCAPCHILSPMLEDLSLKYRGISFVRVNSDESPLISSRYYIMSLPTTLLFLDGQPIDRIVGVLPYEAIEVRIAWLNRKLYYSE
ncbi:MAG: thioredoxin domain-containing protein [Caldisphaeraceae archaeon]|nr:thioredoxin domain-containing protein [Caldisphaeraceae archaeon]